jgi:hypothetical protein
MVEALRSDPDLVAVSGNYDGREGPLVELTDDICGDRYDGTGGFAGFAFAVKGEWFQSGYRFPTECKWWFGDNDLVMAAYTSGVGKIGIAVDAHVEHLDGGSKTGGDWTHLAEQIRADKAAFEARWRALTGKATVAVVSSIYGGYDQPLEQPEQDIDVRWLLVTDTPTDVKPWDVMVVSSDLPPREAARAAKFEPWRFTDADAVVWIDGRVKATPHLARWMVAHLDTGDVALWRHPMRSSILDEAQMCLQENPAKYQGDIPGQAKRYLDEGCPDGLWQCTLIAYRVNDTTRELGRVWAEECAKHPTSIDQVSFPYAAWKAGARVVDLPGGLWDHHGPLFTLEPHEDGT